jgi:hypothetical protein
VKTGKRPNLAGAIQVDHYESLKRPAVADAFYVVTRTAGASFHGGAGMGQYYGRTSGDRLLIVEPRPGSAPCVAELWKIP